MATLPSPPPPPCIVCGAAAAPCDSCDNAVCPSHGAGCADCGDVVCGDCVGVLPLDTNYYCQPCIIVHTTPTDHIVACQHTFDRAAATPSAKGYLDPAIVTMTFTQSKLGSKPTTPLALRRPSGAQAEHIIPNSCFLMGAGRHGTPVPGAALYKEGTALTYWVEDDQSHGTEHKLLTDREREFAQYCVTHGQSPTLQDWLAYMESVTAETLKKRNLSAAGLASGLTKDEAVKAAAKALFDELRDHFVNVLHIPLATPLAHGVVQCASKVPIAGSTGYFLV